MQLAWRLGPGALRHRAGEPGTRKSADLDGPLPVGERELAQPALFSKAGATGRCGAGADTASGKPRRAAASDAARDVPDDGAEAAVTA